MEINKLAWKIGGEAGYGILTAGRVFSMICKQHGLNVFGLTDYPSLIRGGHNTVTIRVEEKELSSPIKPIDVLVALDELTIKEHINEISNAGCLIYDEKANIDKSRNDIIYLPVKLEEISGKYSIKKKFMMSTAGIGASAAIIGFELDEVNKVISKVFNKKGEKVINENKDVIKSAYDYVKEHHNIDFKNKIEKRFFDPGKIFLNGNQAVSIGAIASGCKFISAYPMTPSTGILEYLTSRAKDYGIVSVQTEDEITAINMALGASFAGVRSMTCTSGGGFALMNETISLSGCAEVPVVIVLGQRPGPATGLPTRTEQGDLRYAIHAGHGAFPKAVIAPGDVNECFDLIQTAFNTADKFQIPVIFLTDKFLGVSVKTMDQFKKLKEIDKGEIIRECKDPGEGNKFNRYKITDSGISPRPLPGTPNGFYCAIGDEHDEQGNIIESSAERNSMMDKRMKKMQGIKEYLGEVSVQSFGSDDSEIIIIGWGSTKGVILQAQEFLEDEGIKTKFLQVKVLHPFFEKRIIEEISDKCKAIIVIENNNDAQLAGLLKEHACIPVNHCLLKYDGRPFFPEDILFEVKRINDQLKGS